MSRDFAQNDPEAAATPPTEDALTATLEKYIEREPELEAENLTMTPRELAKLILAVHGPLSAAEDALREALEALHFLAYPNPPDWIKREEMIAFARAKYVALSAAGPSEQEKVGELERRLGTTEAHLDQALDLLDEVDRYVGFIQWELKDRLIDFLSRHRPKQ